MAAEAHRVRERDANVGLARLVRARSRGRTRGRAARSSSSAAARRRGTASTHIIASIAPAAPKQWPITDFVDETASSVRVVAEDLLDRLRLGGVAERRRGAVRVDVVDPLGRDAGAIERGPHHLDDADRLGIGLRHVVRVVRRAVAEHLGVDLGAARPRALVVLEQRARTRPRPSRTRRASRRTAARPAAGARPRRRARASPRSRRGSAGACRPRRRRRARRRRRRA